jgi:hypothetical protein
MWSLRTLVDAGEQPRRRTTGNGGGGETLGREGGLRAREIGRGGEVRRPAAEAEGQRRRHAYAWRVAGGGENGGIWARERRPGKIRV